HSQDVLKCAAGDSFEVAVISSNLDGPLTGFDVLRQLRVLNSCLRGIMLLDSSRREVVLEAFRAGARGIFSRHEYIETLSKHIRSVHHGQLCANSQQMSYAVEALSSGPVLRAVDSNGLSLLSERELEVVRCLAEGLTNREIAERLGLSQHTVKNYLFRVFDKLGVSSRIELLFLTLTQPITPSSPALPLAEASAHGNGHQDTTAVSYQGGEEYGLPNAQIALAERYLQGKGVEKDPVSAYMWYLLSERASVEMTDQINIAKRTLAETLTPEDILEAQKRAAEQLKKAAKSSPSQSTHRRAAVASGAWQPSTELHR